MANYLTIIKNELNTNVVIYELVSNSRNTIGNIQCCISTSNIYKKRYVTRSSIKKEATVISILWLGIDNKFRGQGLGTLLINHALSDLKLHNPSINYAIVDDDTSDADSIKNIYTSIGFEYQCPIALVSSTKIGQLQGPERQLNLDYMS
jgi:GNAT superfamily N-acetyltransferase